MDKNNHFKVPLSLMLILVFYFFGLLAWFSYENYGAGSNPWQIASSSLLISIPLGLTCFSTAVLEMTARQKREKKAISRGLAKVVYWTPRIAGIVIALFAALFALDVFTPGGNFWLMLAGFFIHASPSIAMGILLAFAWRWEQVGFYAFLLAGILFLRFLFGNPLSNFGIIFLFSLPMLAIALLFRVNWKSREEIRSQMKKA